MDDLRIWARALATGTLLSPATQTRRLHTNFLQNGFNYGLGLMEINGFFGHGGNILGYNSAMFCLPSRAEQVRVNRLRHAGLLAIALHNLLDSARPWVGGRLGASESLGRV